MSRTRGARRERRCSTSGCWTPRASSSRSRIRSGSGCSSASAGPTASSSSIPRCEPPADAQPFRAEIFSLLQEGIEAHWSSDRVLADLHPRMELFPELSARSERIAGKLRSDDAVVALLTALDGTRSLWRVIQAREDAPRPGDDLGARRRRGAHLPRRRQAGLGARERRRRPGRDRDDGRARGLSRPARGRRLRPPQAEPRRTRRRPPSCAARSARSTRGSPSSTTTSSSSWPADCDAAAIKHAYHVAAKIYHPDTLARSGLDAEARAEANRVFAEISKAHATLSDPAATDRNTTRSGAAPARGSTPTGWRTPRTSTARARS